MSTEQRCDDTVEVLINKALAEAIERNDSQTVIDLLSIATEYIDGEDANFSTPIDNIQDTLQEDTELF